MLFSSSRQAKLKEGSASSRSRFGSSGADSQVGKSAAACDRKRSADEPVVAMLKRDITLVLAVVSVVNSTRYLYGLVRENRRHKHGIGRNSEHIVVRHVVALQISGGQRFELQCTSQSAQVMKNAPVFLCAPLSGAVNSFLHARVCSTTQQ